MGLTNFRNLVACFSSKSKKESNFLSNGGRLLEELISFCDGKCNPIRSFSAMELKLATNNYDKQQLIVYYNGGGYALYKGFLQDCPIIVKKFLLPTDICPKEAVFKEIAFASVFSSHNNVLKLLGCCLETDYLILVFEHAENGNLEDLIFAGANANRASYSQPLSWKVMLKIAADLCNAVAYLHNVFPKPIIHRNILPRNILLDENNAAKLSDFVFSRAIPDGEFQVEDIVIGTYGFSAPDYVETGWFDEKIDVYSVGAVLLQLLTGKRMKGGGYGYENSLESCVKKSVEEGSLNEIVDSRILGPRNEQQLQAFAEIALQCLGNVEDRPAVIQVAKKLGEIYPT